MNLLFWKQRERYEDAVKKVDEAIAETKRMKALLAECDKWLTEIFGALVNHDTGKNNGNEGNAPAHK